MKTNKETPVLRGQDGQNVETFTGNVTRESVRTTYKTGSNASVTQTITFAFDNVPMEYILRLAVATLTIRHQNDMRKGAKNADAFVKDNGKDVTIHVQETAQRAPKQTATTKAIKAIASLSNEEKARLLQMLNANADA